MRFVTSLHEDLVGDQPGLLISLPVKVQDALASAVQLVESGNRLLCHPVVTFLQVRAQFRPCKSFAFLHGYARLGSRLVLSLE